MLDTFFILLFIFGVYCVFSFFKNKSKRNKFIKIESSYTDDFNPDDYINEDNWEQHWQHRLENYLGYKPTNKENNKYIKAFGGDLQCVFNLTMFMSRVDNGIKGFIADEDDYYRKRYDTLAKTDVLIYADNIPFHNMLELVSMADLRKMQKTLGSKPAKSKIDLITNLLAIDNIRVKEEFEKLDYYIEDFFYINPEYVK